MVSAFWRARYAPEKGPAGGQFGGFFAQKVREKEEIIPVGARFGRPKGMKSRVLEGNATGRS